MLKSPSGKFYRIKDGVLQVRSTEFTWTPEGGTRKDVWTDCKKVAFRDRRFVKSLPR